MNFFHNDLIYYNIVLYKMELNVNDFKLEKYNFTNDIKFMVKLFLEEMV